MEPSETVQIIKLVLEFLTPIVVGWMAYRMAKLNKKQDVIERKVEEVATTGKATLGYVNHAMEEILRTAMWATRRTAQLAEEAGSPQAEHDAKVADETEKKYNDHMAAKARVESTEAQTTKAVVDAAKAITAAVVEEEIEKKVAKGD